MDDAEEGQQLLQACSAQLVRTCDVAQMLRVHIIQLASWLAFQQPMCVYRPAGAAAGQ
jgi:hypothetical protein